MKPGVLLLNLGSPDSTGVADVRAYLREFLSDERVIDAPAPVRAAVLNLFILPFRPKDSSHAYQQIWTPEGSPLIVSTEHQRDALRERLDQIPVEIGMRYGNPSTGAAIRRLLAQEVDHIFLIPLYPHYAMSSYETAVAKAWDELEGASTTTEMTVQPPFYADADYIEALYQTAKPKLDEAEFDLLLFSYHGVPERHIRKSDPSGAHCLRAGNCCDVPSAVHGTCYRAQCFATSRAFAARAGIDDSRWRLAFQSRLGRDPWLRPYTDATLEALPSEGIRRVAVICPAFVSDCLETLEEIDMRGRETFIEAGGIDFRYIPCLNDSPGWISVMERMTNDWLRRLAA